MPRADVLSLQRHAGNRAVSRLLLRLPEKTIRKAFKSAFAPNIADLAPEVIQRIATVTDAWEGAAPTPGDRRDRRSAIEAALTSYLQDGTRIGQPLPHPGDPDHWERIVRLLQREIAPEALPPQRPLAGPGGNAPAPLRQRPVVHCTMGQGVVADLHRYSLLSDRFSTCSPVVLINDRTGVAGLFHYAAGQPGQQRELAEMHAMVDPTRIGLNRRSTRTPGGEPDYSRDDYESLSAWAAGLRVPAFRIPLEGNQYHVFMDDAGVIRIDGDVPASAGVYDATNFTTSRALNAEARLLVSTPHYDAGFASRRYADALES